MRPLYDRFWDKVEFIPFHTCWEWKACKTPKGYGFFCVKTNKFDSAHRLSYKLHFGSIPKGLHVLHKCDNPGCVRPEHLFVGTNRDNMQDRKNKGRYKSTTGDNNHNTLVPDALVLLIRQHRALGYTRKQSAKKFNLSWATIKYILASRSRKYTV